jgi:hypothetical protein
MELQRLLVEAQKEKEEFERLKKMQEEEAKRSKRRTVDLTLFVREQPTLSKSLEPVQVNYNEKKPTEVKEEVKQPTKKKNDVLKQISEELKTVNETVRTFYIFYLFIIKVITEDEEIKSLKQLVKETSSSQNGKELSEWEKWRQMEITKLLEEAERDKVEVERLKQQKGKERFVLEISISF